jgi:hypothetical protein
MNLVISAQKLPLLFTLAGLLLGFGFARLNTRLIRAHTSWWPFKDIERGGLHLHHAVFGIVLMVLAGTTFIGANPDDVRWSSVLAFFFGVGVGLVLDEFALILHLKDVYWAEEGRQSITAVIMAVVFAGFLIIGLSPLGVRSPSLAGSLWVFVATIVINLGLLVVVSLKGKYFLVFLGFFVIVFALVGAIRVARPGSPWARSRYGKRPAKLARSREREAAWARRKRRILEFIGGRPTARGTGSGS